MPTTTARTRPNAMPAVSSHQRPAATHSRLQKQLSYIEAHKAQHNVTSGVTSGSSSERILAARKATSNGYVRRGASVDRSLDGIRQRLTSHKSAFAYEAQSKNAQHRIAAAAAGGNGDRLTTINSQKSIESAVGGSTSSILKSLDHELKQVNCELEQRYNYKSVVSFDEPVDVAKVTSNECAVSKTNLPATTTEFQLNFDDSPPAPRSGDSSKVNLNIVLSHAINFKSANSNESNNSDIESCSEITEPKRKSTPYTRASSTDLSTTTNCLTAKATTVQQRRAQFRSSRNVSINESTAITTTKSVPAAATHNNLPTIFGNQYESAAPSTAQSVPCAPSATPAVNTSGPICSTPTLIVQRRPPLVRAMSAPVRSRSLDEQKAVFAFQKRKLRRRKLITRNASVCDKSGGDGGVVGDKVDDKNDVLFDLKAVGCKKPSPLTRTRSTLAVDVITLVSLVSSEGSESEKEDNTPKTGRGSKVAERSRSTGTPSLRKTGKSENYPPNFQLATKEYSHMIRRGSIIPFAARLRSSRPPTAPPVPIFMTESTINSKNNNNNANTMPSTSPCEKLSTSDSNANRVANEDTQSSTRNTTELGCDDQQTNDEYNYPQYVRSLKERECWKLYRKMSMKGVSVSYETVLRGMLTPTEFRQIQKQREIEEAKARALEEEKNAVEEVQSIPSAMERLTQKLLKK